MGCDAIKQKDLTTGRMYIEESCRVNGLDFVNHYNMAVLNLCQGQMAPARAHLEAAKAIKHTRTDTDYTDVLNFTDKLMCEAEKAVREKGMFDIKQIQLLTVN